MTDHASRSDEQARLAAALHDAYAIERPLGHGGMATVYLARDVKHDRAVAIKVLRPELYSRSFAERFLAEITVTAGLQHPHILPLFDSGAVDELLYYVMPYVEGGTLRDKLRATPQLPIAEAVRLATEVAGALEHAHQQGIIHRDIKPENILLQDGSALVADFGIATSIANNAGERLTGTGLAIGTPAYMSPEQASGERALDARSDVYALGAVLYEMLAGVTPHTGDSAGQLLARVLTTDPEPLPTKRTDVSRPLAAVIAKALARRSSERWASAGAFAAALESPPPVTAPVKARRAPAMWPRIAVAASVLLAAGAAAWWQWFRVSPPPVVTSRKQITFVGNVENVSLSPDGRQLAYAAAGEDSLSIFVADVAGGNAIKLTTLPSADVNSFQWSPDGTRLLLMGTAGSTPFGLVIPALGGEARRLPIASLGGSLSKFGSWLPDGKRISVWSAKDAPSNRYVTFDLETSDTVSGALTSASATAFNGGWSASSTRLLFQQLSDSGFSLVAAGLSGNPRTIMQTAQGDSVLIAPQWAPRDEAVFGIRNFGELVRLPLRADGYTPAALPQVLATDLSAWGSPIHFMFSTLSLSADARRVVYTHEALHSNVIRVPASGAAQAMTNSTTMKLSPAMSPDGTRLAYVEDDVNGTSNLWVMDLVRGTRRQVSFNIPVVWSMDSFVVAWSPDGSQLAAIVVAEDRNRVALFDPAGGQSMRLLGDLSPQMAPGISWAPAPRVLLTTLAQGVTLHMVDPVTGRDSALVTEPKAWAMASRATRDGAHVAYYRMDSDSTGTGLYVTSRGAPPRKWAGGYLIPLGWSKDGASVIARVGASRQIVAVSADGRVRPVAQAPKRRDLCSPLSGSDPLALLCLTYVSVTDAWLLELTSK